MDPGLLHGRHPATVQLAGYFDPDRVPTYDPELTVELEHAAAAVISKLPDCPELTVGLRKLLEARDCFHRAATEATP